MSSASVNSIQTNHNHILSTTQLKSNSQGFSESESDVIDDAFCDVDDPSMASSYMDPSTNDLTILSGAALLTADCMGTGILALPHDMKVLGSAFGLSFLVVNLPINLYAGTILGRCAGEIERRLAGLSAPINSQHGEESRGDNGQVGVYIELSREKKQQNNSSLELNGDKSSGKGYQTIGGNKDKDSDSMHETLDESVDKSHPRHEHRSHTANTNDFIGITSALFDNYSMENKAEQRNRGTGRATFIVTAIYYTNIFLVLGNYILVMSHAVVAMIGKGKICLPVAGVVASTLMFLVSQLRTMANLGRSVSAISLLTLAVVVVQCLLSVERADYRSLENNDTTNVWTSMMRQFAALSSIGFAVGSQKLFLNIRHEFKTREHAPISLGISLSTFGTIYLTVCLLAGPNPPELLFDAINEGIGRRIAGFLLWVHVSVSFAINSQALCSSIDRLRFHKVKFLGLNERHKSRWAILTLLVSASSYLVANVIPFFKDLVALIGALTSVPLTLLLPAIFHRKLHDLPLFKLKSFQDLASHLLVVFSLIFLISGVIGSLDSIRMDWANHGPPFACN